MSIVDCLESVQGSQGEQATICEIAWPPEGFSAELLGLILKYPHHRELHQALALSPEDAAAYLYARLSVPGGSRWALMSGRNLAGLMHVREATELSDKTTRSLLLIDEVLLDPRIADSEAQALIEQAIAAARARQDHIRVQVPASDVRLARALGRLGFGVTGGQAVLVADSLPNQLPPSADLRVHPYRALAPADLPGFARALGCDVPWPARTASGTFFPADKEGRWTLVARWPGKGICGVITARRDLPGRQVELEHLAELEFVWMAAEAASDELAELLIRHALVRLHGEGVRVVRLNQTLADPGGGCSLDVLGSIGFKRVQHRLVMEMVPEIGQTAVVEPFCSEVDVPGSVLVVTK